MPSLAVSPRTDMLTAAAVAVTLAGCTIVSHIGKMLDGVDRRRIPASRIIWLQRPTVACTICQAASEPSFPNSPGYASPGHSRLILVSPMQVRTSTVLENFREVFLLFSESFASAGQEQVKAWHARSKLPKTSMSLHFTLSEQVSVDVFPY